MDTDQIMGFIRQALMIAGTYVATTSWGSDLDWPAIVGAIMTLIGVVWSFWIKIGTTRVPTPTLTASQKVEVKNTSVVAK